MPSLEIPVRIMDLPAFKQWAAEVEAEFVRLKRECDEWEERYEELLAAVGGVWPG